MPVCYFMDSFACGFETRGFAPQTVSPRPAHFISWNDANAHDVLLMPYRRQRFLYVVRSIVAPENCFKETFLLIRVVDGIFIEIDLCAALRTEFRVGPHLMAASGAADKGFHLDEALLIQLVKRVHITVIGPPGVDFNMFFVLVEKQLHRTVPHILQGNIKILILLVSVDHEMFFIPAVHVDADIIEAIKNQPALQ